MNNISFTCFFLLLDLAMGKFSMMCVVCIDISCSIFMDNVALDENLVIQVKVIFLW